MFAQSPGFAPHPPARVGGPRGLARTDRLLAEARDENLNRLHEGTPDEPADLARALRFIHANLFDPGLTAAAVHAAAGSPRLRAHLRRAAGLGVRTYIEQARLFVAMRLLHLDSIELYLVAEAVGYDQYETFCRAFKRHYGCPPSAAREQRACTRRAEKRQLESSPRIIKVE